VNNRIQVGAIRWEKRMVPSSIEWPEQRVECSCVLHRQRLHRCRASLGSGLHSGFDASG
jgi:hypothetical protein